MSDLTILAAGDPSGVSADLTRRAAGMALRLATLVQSQCSEESGAPGVSDFLSQWALSVDSDPAALVRDPSPGTPLAALADGLGLSAVEVSLVVLAGLPEEHEGLASTLRAIHPRGRAAVGVGLAAAVLGLDRAILRRILHDGPAVAGGLLQVVGDGAFFERSLGLADQVWEALHGADAWPAALHRVDVPVPPAGLRGWLGLPAVGSALTAIRERHDRLIVVGSGDETIALSRCSVLACEAGWDSVAARVPVHDRQAIDLLVLHALLRGAVPVIVAVTDDSATSSRLELGPVTAGPVLLCAAPGVVVPPPDRPVLTVPLGPIGSADRRAAWRTALPGVNGAVGEIAARHPLDPAVTALVARDLDGPDGLRPISLAEVSAAVRGRAAISLPAGVELISPRATWDQLVLGAGPSQQLREAVTRLDHQSEVLEDWGLRERSRADGGVRLLLSGPPGTGKTLTGHVVAAAAATDLLVVDVSRVVSKWLGDTEKNLASIFDVAEQTQAVLFLDEADALFAVRTDVEDAHDRYANQSTSWLLQRLDHFDGLAVLATNLRRNIDAAFVRRMDFVVEFALPDEASRMTIWEQHLPVGPRSADIDIGSLARQYPVPGAWIRNAVIAAAFRAAADRTSINQSHLVAAMRREYAKAARPFPDEPIPRTGPRDERAAAALTAARLSAERAAPPDTTSTNRTESLT